MSTAGPLIERDHELAGIDQAVSAARGGRGCLMVLDGPAGIGKTALCGQVERCARDHGMRVLSATGAHIERDFSYGVVRQLFEPVVRSATPGQRTRLFAGAAAPAAALIGGMRDDTAASLPDQPYAVLHALHWLTANLAGDAPLAVVVDDAHWGDSASLRYALHVARRLGSLPALLLLAVRTGDPPVDAAVLGEIRALPGATVMTPAPLSECGVAQLVSARLGPADDGFAAACHRSTGGVPYYVGELVDALARDGVAPTGAAASRVTALGPSRVADVTLQRLARLGCDAVEAARAVAVLGPHADVARVAVLAQLDRDRTLDVVDSLVVAGVLTDRSPLGFVHPIVEAAIDAAMPRGARDKAHRDAAAVLAREGADIEEVAAHLLATAPGAGGEHDTTTLRWAAAHALGRGAPDSAVAYLRRALDDARTAGDRTDVLRELGRAEALVRDPHAAEHLEAALAATRNVEVRAAIAADLADVLGSHGRWEARIGLIRSALAELGDSRSAQRLHLERQLAGLEAYDPRYVAGFDRRLAERRRLVAESGSAARDLALLLAAVTAWRGGEASDVAPLVARGLDGGRFLVDRGAGSPSLGQAVAALVLVERLDEARSLVDAMVADAERRGSAFGTIQATACRVWIAAQLGELAGVEADMRAVADASAERGDVLGLVSLLHFGLDALIERAELADVAASAERVRLPDDWQGTLTGALFLEVRGRLRVQRGDAAGGIADLRDCRDILDAVRFGSAVVGSCRTALALALPASARGEACRLAVEQLERASAIGQARGVCRSLRAAGVLAGGERGIELLRESVAMAQRCPSTLELARSQVELGAALRRLRQPVAARHPLAAGRQLAERCGALRLAARAAVELRASGARPRRSAVSGPDALTPAEDRVARLAAAGLSNGAIAQELYISAKTVENHLGRAYQKLGVHTRKRLADVFDGPAS